jgi:dynein heavy chain
MACAMMESIIYESDMVKKTTEYLHIKTFLTQTFIFCLLWSIGGNAIDASRELIELFVKELFDENPYAR